MDRRELFTEEQLDYLVEMLNIGAGNATTALHQLLHCDVSMKLPVVDVVPAVQSVTVLGDPAAPVACLRMRMIGDLDGWLFFLVSDEQQKKLAHLAEPCAMLGPKKESEDADQILGVLAEIANILAGVYLTAIHDFCKLNISHSVPVSAVDMIQSLLDESLATLSSPQQTVILVTNEFIICEAGVKTSLLILPTPGAIQALIDSMKEAGRLYGYKQD